METVFKTILKLFQQKFSQENSDFINGFVTCFRLFSIGYKKTTSFNYKLLFERSRIRSKETRAKLYQAKKLLALSLERNEHTRQAYEQKNLELDEKYARKMNDLRNDYFQKNKEYQKESDQRVSFAYQTYQEQLQKMEDQYYQDMNNLKVKAEELHAKNGGSFEEGTILVLKRAHALELLEKDKKFEARFEASRKAHRENLEKLKLENQQLLLAQLENMDHTSFQLSESQMNTSAEVGAEAIQSLKKAHALELTVKEKKCEARLAASRKIYKDKIAQMEGEMQNQLINQQKKIDKASVNQTYIDIIKKLETNFNKNIETKDRIINELNHEIYRLNNPECKT